MLLPCAATTIPTLLFSSNDLIDWISIMVEVAIELLGSTPIAAVDMPLTVSPSEIIESLAAKIKQMDEGEGVLMLVDMGSLGLDVHACFFFELAFKHRERAHVHKH